MNNKAMKYCCGNMCFYLTKKCPQHTDPWECPDYPLAKFDDGKIGIPIRDGGRSMVVIDYCPWCGKKL